MAKRNTKLSESKNSKPVFKVTKLSKGKRPDASKGTSTKTQTSPPFDAPPKLERQEAVSDYVIVTPPPTIDPQRSSGILIIGVSIVITVIGTYAAWPEWSPYVEEQFPALKYEAVVDPRVASLVGRLDALEKQTSGGIVKSTTISDMENERARLQGEVGQLLKRLDSIDKTIVGVKELVKAINDDGTIGETKRAIDQITQRLMELEREGFNFGEFNSRLDQLETKNSLESYDAVKELADNNQSVTSLIEDLEGRVHSLEATGHSSSTTRADAAAIILAVSQLRKSNLTGKPFNKETDILFALSKDHPDMLAGLSILEKMAKSGVATISILRAEFDKISGSIVNAENENTENSLLEGIRKRVWALISIRKTDIASNEVTVDVVVAQVEEHLRQGDLAAAVKIASQIKGVSELAAKIAEPWLKGAKNRLMVERAVASLHVYAVSLMARGKK